MLTPFIATRLTHACGTIDRYRFATGDVASLAHYPARIIGQDVESCSVVYTCSRDTFDKAHGRKQGLSFQSTFKGRNARRDALAYVERMAAA